MITIKKITLIFTFCLLPFSFLFGQDTWTKTYNPFCEEYVPGMGWIELEVDYEVEDVLVTQDGGYMVSGSFDRWIDDDPPFWFDHWGFLMKTDCDGNLLWAKGDSVDFLGETDNYACVETEDGDLISVGYCYWGGGYMIKRDSEGNRLWAIPYDDFGANSMCKTNDGNIILGGVVASEIALRKIDISGNTIWTKSYNCGYTSIAQSITQTSDNGYALTGLTSGNGYDIIVLKTDENGDSIWTRTFDGYGDYDLGNCIIETSDENILVGGAYSGDNSTAYGILISLSHDGDLYFLNQYNMDNCYVFRSIVKNEVNGEIIGYGKNLSGTTLNGYTSDGDILWISSISGKPASGDKCLQKTLDSGFLCISITYCHDYIVINKTDSLGQTTAVDEYGIPSDNITLISYPNPFSSSAIISFFNLKNTPIKSFSLTGQAKDINIQIYNIKGQLLRDLNLIPISSDKYESIWDGKDRNDNVISNGIYFLKLENSKFKYVKKITKIGE